MSLSELGPWAAANGIAANTDFAAGAALRADVDFRRDPCIDFGRYQRRAPQLVLGPRSLDEAAQCVQKLAAAGCAYKVRGSAHSSGGQVLSNGGCVIDISALSRIVELRPDDGEVEVEGGCTWLSLMQALQPQKLRPPVLTDNLETTIAGTCSVGGVGDTSLHHGLQLGAVRAMTLLTPTGELRQLTPADPLFFHALAGRGQFGILARLRLGLLRRTTLISGRVLRFSSLEHFVQAAQVVRTERLYEFFRAVLLWPPRNGDNPVEVVAGNFSEQPARYDLALSLLRPQQMSELWHSDRFAHYHAGMQHGDYFCPNVELFLPLPDGLALFRKLAARIVETGLLEFFPAGNAVMVLPTDARFALAPFPRTPLCLVVALRPRLPSIDDVWARLPFLRELGRTALLAGGKLYLNSIDLEMDDFARCQFGDRLDEILQMKAALDPRRLCNEGLLPTEHKR